MVFVVHGSGMVRSAWMLAAKQEQLMQFESWIGGSCTCNWFCQDFRGLITVVLYHGFVRFTSFFCILCSVLDSPHFVVGGSGPGEFFVGSCQDSSGTSVLRAFPHVSTQFVYINIHIQIFYFSEFQNRFRFHSQFSWVVSVVFLQGIFGGNTTTCLAAPLLCTSLHPQDVQHFRQEGDLATHLFHAPAVSPRFSGDGGGSSRSWVDALCQVLIWGEWYLISFVWKLKPITYFTHWSTCWCQFDTLPNGKPILISCSGAQVDTCCPPGYDNPLGPYPIPAVPFGTASMK